MLETSRRSFLRGALSGLFVAAAPAMAAATPLAPLLVGDGVHDDGAALNALFNGEPFRCIETAAFRAEEGRLIGGVFRTTQPLIIGRNAPAFTLRGVRVLGDFDKDCIFLTLRGKTLTIDDCWLEYVNLPATGMSGSAFVAPQED